MSSLNKNKMERFTRQNLAQIRSEFTEAVKKMEKLHGISFKIGNISFSSERFTTKLECAILNSDTKSVEESEFKASCRRFGLKPSDFGRKFISSGITYQISGIKTTRHKYPLSAIRIDDGKRYKFSVGSVVNNLI